MNALQAIAIGIGIFGIVTGLWGLSQVENAQRFFRELPRNQIIGRILMAINVAWSLYLFNQMDLGDSPVFLLGMKLGSWNQIKQLTYLAGPFIYLFIIFYVNQYLGARSIAFFLILVAKPILAVCFLRDETSRLVITTLAYLGVVVGIFFFAMPHWMRDMISFFQSSPTRWSWGCKSKVAFGACLILLAAIAY